MTKRTTNLHDLFAAIGKENTKTVSEVGHKLREGIDSEIRRLKDDCGLVTDLLARYGIGGDRMTPKERSAKVREAAKALVGMGATVVTPQEVVALLADQGIVFAVKRPASLAGTVLSQMREFEHIGQSRFRYREPVAP